MSELVLLAAILYLSLLFLVAYWGDRHAPIQWVQNPYVYTLSIAVYCTSWTFYGSVGRAATGGFSFFAVYIGPILLFVFGYYFLLKILRICHQHHITSIADFISARYGGSRVLAGMVSIIAVVGILPYISLQLKAVGSSYDLIDSYSSSRLIITNLFPYQTEFITAIILALFTILFGTRKIDMTEQHRGMVGAIALESLVKLVAFLAVGIYVSYVLFGGVNDVLLQARENPELAELTVITHAIFKWDWWILALLSTMAIVCLPRQFQIMMVENVDERHLKQAVWLFPLYLILINLFVIPIAMVGRLTFDSGELISQVSTAMSPVVSPDTYVLALPMYAGQSTLTMLAFIGGLSAATGMVIVACITLSTMICNDLVVPLFLHKKLKNMQQDFEIKRVLKVIRRVTIVVIMLLGYLYVVLIGDSHTLVSIGLISFAAAAQFFPAIVVGLYWPKASRAGAIYGLAAGFALWAYTLLLPSFVKSGWLAADILSSGPFAIEILNPIALFGISGWGTISHGLFWSLGANFLILLVFSHFSQCSEEEYHHALKFTDALKQPALEARLVGNVTPLLVSDLRNLAVQFTTVEKVDRAISQHMLRFHGEYEIPIFADIYLKQLIERILTGTIGAASAKIVVTGLEHRCQHRDQEVQKILDDASSAIKSNFNLLHGAIENIDQGIIIIDAQGQLLLWNHRFCELCTLSTDILRVGKSFKEILRFVAKRGNIQQQQIADYMKVLQSPQKFIFEHQTHSKLNILVNGNPLPKGGFVVTYTDISEQKKTEATIRGINETLEKRVEERTKEIQDANQALEKSLHQLKDTQEQLVMSEKLAALGQLVAGVAHEINTPIGVCVTSVSFLADKLKQIQALHQQKKLSNREFTDFLETSHRSIEYAMKNLHRAGNLVKSFKQLSVSEYSDEQKQINFYRHLEEILTHLAPRLDQFRPQILIDGPQELSFKSYPAIVSQIFTSLIVNSLKHGFSQMGMGQGIVTISYHINHELLEIKYQDNGCGMSDEQVEKIFEPFYTTTRDKGDAGLGMHIVFNFVTQLLSGTITCVSQPGEGVSFYIRLPLMDKNLTSKNIANKNVASKNVMSDNVLDKNKS